MTRSPVNSGNRRCLYSAGNVKVSVDRLFSSGHLYGDCVIDPVADTIIRPDEWREREGAGVELGDLDLKGDGEGFAGGECGDFVGGFREIKAEVVAEDEADPGVDYSL